MVTCSLGRRRCLAYYPALHLWLRHGVCTGLLSVAPPAGLSVLSAGHSGIVFAWYFSLCLRQVPCSPTKTGGTAARSKKKIARLPVIEFIDRFLQHVLPRGKRHVRDYGYLSPGRRAESLKIIRELFHMEAKQEEDEVTENGDEPTKQKDEPSERICPRCEKDVMVSRQESLPTVHQIMQMTLDQLRQPTCLSCDD